MSRISHIAQLIPQVLQSTLHRILRLPRSITMRISLVLSVMWSVVLITLTLSAYSRAPSFQAALSEPCPLLLNQLVPQLEARAQAFHPSLQLPIVGWSDQKSGDQLSMFRPGEQAKACVFLEQRARLHLERLRSGKIEPRLTVRYEFVASAILLPSVVFFLVALLFGRRA